MGRSFTTRKSQGHVYEWVGRQTLYSRMVPTIVLQAGEIWALTGYRVADTAGYLRRWLDRDAAWVSARHAFRNLSNTTDLYYQQRYNSYDAEDSMTVRQYLDEAGSAHDPSFLSHIEEVLQLSPLLDEQLIKLSNGETRKVMIAEAWAKRPMKLLLDHPFTGLDAGSRERLPALLREIASTGTTVLLATDPQDIPEDVDRVAIINGNAVEKIMDRKDYQPGLIQAGVDIPLDKEKLSLLLEGRKPAEFSTILRMRDVSIEYQGRRILDQINWEVLPGERWALTGPNGAGKSTLLSLVVGDNPQAYANDITLFDRRRGTGESIWDIKRHTGFVSPEFYQYFPTQTLCMHAIESGFFDTVGLFRASDPALEAICSAWMKMLGIAAHAWKPLNQVSPDVQRLCLLARALVRNPALLVLDEPTQGLDPAQQQFFVQLVDAICGLSDVTLLYVSHYREHIPSAVTHELRLDNGKMVHP
jgi:molybdate transport system ATP-binding protein